MPRRSIASSDKTKQLIQQALVAKTLRNRQRPAVQPRSPVPQRQHQKTVAQRNERPQRIVPQAVRPPDNRLYTVESSIKRLDLPEAGSFNASILDLGDRLLMVNRPNELELVACFMDRQHEIDRGSFVKLPLLKVADPRLTLMPDNRVLLSYSRYFHSVTLEHIAGSVIMDLNKSRDEIKLTESYRVSPKSLTQRQKNWMPFVHDGAIYFVASVSPHEVYEFKPNTHGEATRAFTCKWAPRWLYPSTMRGNTNACLMEDGNFLCTFHTATDIRGTLHYDNGFYMFEGKPPFRPIDCSRVTYLPAESAVEPHFRKAGIIRCNFPCGMIVDGDRVTISYGDNDSCVKIMETTIHESRKTFEDYSRENSQI